VGLVKSCLPARTASCFLVLHLVGCAGVVLAQRRILAGLLPNDPARTPGGGRAATGRVWLAHATPMIVVSLFTTLFVDLETLLVSPFLAADQIAVFGVCLKLALMTGFA